MSSNEAWKDAGAGAGHELASDTSLRTLPAHALPIPLLFFRMHMLPFWAQILLDLSTTHQTWPFLASVRSTTVRLNLLS